MHTAEIISHHNDIAIRLIMRKPNNERLILSSADIKLLSRETNNLAILRLVGFIDEFRRTRINTLYLNRYIDAIMGEGYISSPLNLPSKSTHNKIFYTPAGIFTRDSKPCLYISSDASADDCKRFMRAVESDLGKLQRDIRKEMKEVAEKHIIEYNDVLIYHSAYEDRDPIIFKGPDRQKLIDSLSNITEEKVDFFIAETTPRVRGDIHYTYSNASRAEKAIDNALRDARGLTNKKILEPCDIDRFVETNSYGLALSSLS